MKNVLKDGRSVPRWTRFAVAGLFAAVLAGCGGGSDGANGTNGTNGTNADPAITNNLQAQITALTQATNPETCVECHSATSTVAASGTAHQAEYNKYKDTSLLSLVINSVSTVANPAPATTYTSTLTFTAKKSGVALTKAEVVALAQKKL